VWTFLWPGPAYWDVGVLLLAILLDAVLPEPPPILHPVVWMGKAITILESLSPQSGNRAQFVTGAAIGVGVPLAFGAAAWGAAYGLTKLGPLAYLLGGAILLRTTFTVKGLSTAGLDTKRKLETGNLHDARASLRNLVSRDTATLSEPQVAAAAIESLAENTTDSYVAPWLAFGLLGIPGAFMYRAVNTLDSMIGYRGKYEYLGKASARLDDALNYIPARLSGILVLLSAAVLRLRVRLGCTTMWREHGRTASPNAGWTMSAMAGVLGVALEKEGHYCLGDGMREPEARDIGHAVRVGIVVAVLGIGAGVGVVAARQALTG